MGRDQLGAQLVEHAVALDDLDRLGYLVLVLKEDVRTVGVEEAERVERRAYLETVGEPGK